MRWLRQSFVLLLVLLLSLCGLATVLVIGALLYSLHYIQTPPVDDPTRELLSWYDPGTLDVERPPPFLQHLLAQRGSPLLIDDFLDPPLQYGPWTRWWWPGNLVQEPQLRQDMALFAQVGIAGVEIQPFGISVSDTDRSSAAWRERGWDSPAFYANLASVMDSARTLGMSVDLNNGSGWPTGGPHVALDDGLRQLVHSELLLDGPQSVDVELPAPSMPVAAFAAGVVGMLGDTPMQTFVPEQRQLVTVIAAQVTGGERTPVPWDFHDTLQLDVSTLQELTSRVIDGRLAWQVPQGQWAVIALWQMPGGELVAGGYAHPRPGYVVDHLDAQRIRANQAYLFRPETGLAKYYGDPLRAFFNDSLEFRQERHWARGHLEAFEQRIGYNPRPFLSALVEPGADQMPFHALNITTSPEYDLGQVGRRFVEDWDQVTSDLFVERYMQTMRRWGSENRLAHRLQGYGGPVDIIRAAGESHIPETEQLYAGGSEMFMRAVSSGAHIAGRPLISAEGFIFVGKAFMTTPQKIKALADKAFSAGVNQLVYHGTSYQVEEHAQRGYPAEDGWYPWQLGLLSTDFSENWEYWPHARVINRYIARMQYLLRKGEPDVDVLLLYPGLNFPQGYNSPHEPFDQGQFEGEDTTGNPEADAPASVRTQHMRDTWRVAREMETRGLTWAWVNEQALAAAEYRDGYLHVGKLRSRGLHLHAIEAVLPATAEKIASLASTGMPLKVSGVPPARQRGLHNWQQGDQRVREAFAELPDAQPLHASTVAYDHKHIRALRRRLANGDALQFFFNLTDSPADLVMQVSESSLQAVWLDAWRGTVNELPLNSRQTLEATLPAYGSGVLWLRAETDTAISPAPAWHEFDAVGLENWSLSVIDADFTHRGDLPGDWRGIPALRHSGGPGNYEVDFELSPETIARVTAGGRLQLQLQKVYGAATATLNGQPLEPLLVSPWTVELGSAVRAGHNKLVLTLIPPRKNRLAPQIKAGEPGWNAPDLGGTDALVAAGIVGPARLVELNQEVLPTQ